MATQVGLHGFNSATQKVDPRYAWINEMIEARQKLMKLYVELAEGDVNEVTLSNFCDTLIDYLSHGHFDLYPKILELVENASGRSLSIASRAMPAIENTSDYLMRFNDIYALEPDEIAMKELPGNLVEIKRCLQSRFRNEDRLIIGLRLVHAAVETPAVKK